MSNWSWTVPLLPKWNGRMTKCNLKNSKVYFFYFLSFWKLFFDIQAELIESADNKFTIFIFAFVLPRTMMLEYQFEHIDLVGTSKVIYQIYEIFYTKIGFNIIIKYKITYIFWYIFKYLIKYSKYFYLFLNIGLIFNYFRVLLYWNIRVILSVFGVFTYYFRPYIPGLYPIFSLIFMHFTWYQHPFHTLFTGGSHPIHLVFTPISLAIYLTIFTDFELILRSYF